MRLDEADLAIAERGLASVSPFVTPPLFPFLNSPSVCAALETLLQAPHSHFLPPKLQIATSRLLLAISLDPAFFAAHPSSAESAAVYPATSASKGIDIAKQSNKFRRGVLKSLKASLEGAGGAEGLVDRAVEVWRRGATDGDEEVRFGLFSFRLGVTDLSSLFADSEPLRRRPLRLYRPRPPFPPSSPSQHDLRTPTAGAPRRTRRRRDLDPRRSQRVPRKGDRAQGRLVDGH